MILTGAYRTSWYPSSSWRLVKQRRDDKPVVGRPLRQDNHLDKSTDAAIPIALRRPSRWTVAQSFLRSAIHAMFSIPPLSLISTLECIPNKDPPQPALPTSNIAASILCPKDANRLLTPERTPFVHRNRPPAPRPVLAKTVHFRRTFSLFHREENSIRYCCLLEGPACVLTFVLS